MNKSKEKTCCFTGHRVIPPHMQQIIYERLKVEIVKLINKDYLYFGTGGALGFDTLAAKAVLELREKHPIKLILVLPCKNQNKYWKKQDIFIYETIKKRCNKCVYTSEHYYLGCMDKRNIHLVDNSSVCIAYLKNINSGTALTVSYAEKSKIKVIDIA